MENLYYKGFPKKGMGSGALFLNDRNEIIFVKPTYKDYWSLPGGVVDENESPRQACIRELKEELGLEIKNVEFLCVDYVATTPEKDENLQFIFFGGKLTPEQISSIKLPSNEIAEYKFMNVEEASPLLNAKLRKRIPECLTTLKEKSGIYLENSQRV